MVPSQEGTCNDQVRVTELPDYVTMFGLDSTPVTKPKVHAERVVTLVNQSL